MNPAVMKTMMIVIAVKILVKMKKTISMSRHCSKAIQ